VKLEDAQRWRHDTENASAPVRHRAVLELIAAGEYLSYSDAKHAARLALSGAHKRCGETNTGGTP
jgi:hypothetical protein